MASSNDIDGTLYIMSVRLWPGEREATVKNAERSRSKHGMEAVRSTVITDWGLLSISGKLRQAKII